MFIERFVKSLVCWYGFVILAWLLAYFGAKLAGSATDGVLAVVCGTLLAVVCLVAYSESNSLWPPLQVLAFGALGWVLFGALNWGLEKVEAFLVHAFSWPKALVVVGLAIIIPLRIEFVESRIPLRLRSPWFGD